MKLTKVEEEGLRLAMTLAISGEQMTLPALAEKEQLSEALVAKIISKLRRGGVVKALRGRNGGYELVQTPDVLTVGAIMKSLGTPLLQGCFNRPVEDGSLCCPHGRDCGMRPVWKRIEGQIEKVMDRITLADIIRSESFMETRVTKLIPANLIDSDKSPYENEPNGAMSS